MLLPDELGSCTRKRHFRLNSRFCLLPSFLDISLYLHQALVAMESRRTSRRSSETSSSACYDIVAILFFFCILLAFIHSITGYKSSDLLPFSEARSTIIPSVIGHNFSDLLHFFPITEARSTILAKDDAYQTCASAQDLNISSPFCAKLLATHTPQFPLFAFDRQEEFWRLVPSSLAEDDREECTCRPPVVVFSLEQDATLGSDDALRQQCRHTSGKIQLVLDIAILAIFRVWQRCCGEVRLMGFVFVSMASG